MPMAFCGSSLCLVVSLDVKWDILHTKYAVHKVRAFMVKINPLTPDLNPPVQRQPAKVFKFGIQFLTLTLRKKIITHTLFLQISGNKIS
jgi:hypothetical protein